MLEQANYLLERAIKIKATTCPLHSCLNEQGRRSNEQGRRSNEQGRRSNEQPYCCLLFTLSRVALFEHPSSQVLTRSRHGSHL